MPELAACESPERRCAAITRVAAVSRSSVRIIIDHAEMAGTGAHDWSAPWHVPQLSRKWPEYGTPVH